MEKHELPKLAAPAKRALQGVNIHTLNDLTHFGENEISDLHGMGPNAMKTIKEALKAHGLGFKP